MSNLLEIQDRVQQFAEAISLALDLDVEIIDKDLIRVASKGNAEERIGLKIDYNGIINKYIYGKGHNTIFIDKPGKDEKCKLCKKYNKCMYKSIVYSAITYGEEIIGCMGIVAFNEEQAKLIEEKFDIMMNFTNKISELLAYEVVKKKVELSMKTYSLYLKSAIDNFDKGVILIDENNLITEMNSYILDKLNKIRYDLLGIDINDIFENIIIEKTDEYSEIIYENEDKLITFYYKINEIILDDNKKVFMILLEDIVDTSLSNLKILNKNKIEFDNIITNDKKFIEFKNRVAEVSKYDSTILLIGETGTGKELFARAIHSNSSRRDKPFVSINCGAIPESLIESELFGYEKGSFTGANQSGKIGKFLLADKGTIFLDEVENMSVYMQQKLLRALETKEIERVGSGKSIPIDVRIISATNKALHTMVSEGHFREDLYHRLNVISFNIPSLVERKNDVLYLAKLFIKEFNVTFGKEIVGITEDVKHIFTNYKWTGNIRELRNTIEHSVGFCKGSNIDIDSLPDRFKDIGVINKGLTLEEIEKKAIINALNMYGNTEQGRIDAANSLGISRATIYRKIKKYELNNI